MNLFDLRYEVDYDKSDLEKEYESKALRREYENNKEDYLAWATNHDTLYICIHNVTKEIIVYEFPDLFSNIEDNNPEFKNEIGKMLKKLNYNYLSLESDARWNWSKSTIAVWDSENNLIDRVEFSNGFKE